MKAFEILLDQDASLTFDDQQTMLRAIVRAYARLRLDHKVDDDIDVTQQGPNDDEEDRDTKLQLSELDTKLNRLTSRVQVRYINHLLILSNY